MKLEIKITDETNSNIEVFSNGEINENDGSPVIKGIEVNLFEYDSCETFNNNLEFRRINAGDEAILNINDKLKIKALVTESSIINIRGEMNISLRLLEANREIFNKEVIDWNHVTVTDVKEIVQ